MMIIHVKVKPNSSEEKIEKISDNSYKIWVKEKPIENKANIYLEKYLKKYFNKPAKIIKGLKSKDKIVEIK